MLAAIVMKHGVTPRTRNLFIFVHVGALRTGSQSTEALQRRRK